MKLQMYIVLLLSWSMFSCSSEGFPQKGAPPGLLTALTILQAARPSSLHYVDGYRIAKQHTSNNSEISGLLAGPSFLTTGLIEKGYGGTWKNKILWVATSVTNLGRPKRLGPLLICEIVALSTDLTKVDREMLTLPTSAASDAGRSVTRDKLSVATRGDRIFICNNEQATMAAVKEYDKHQVNPIAPRNIPEMDDCWLAKHSICGYRTYVEMDEVGHLMEALALEIDSGMLPTGITMRYRIDQYNTLTAVVSSEAGKSLDLLEKRVLFPTVEGLIFTKTSEAEWRATAKIENTSAGMLPLYQVNNAMAAAVDP